jgi:hypothetical protein
VALITEVVDVVGDLRGGERRLLALRMDRKWNTDCCKRDRKGRKKHALHELPPWQRSRCATLTSFLIGSSAGSLENPGDALARNLFLRLRSLNTV